METTYPSVLYGDYDKGEHLNIAPDDTVVSDYDALFQLVQKQMRDSIAGEV
jgi:hypothetical protein